MRRPTDSECDAFENRVLLAFQRTTVQEREQIAADFSAGVRSWPDIEHRGLSPIALKTAALLDTNSDIVCNGDYLKARTLLGCAVLIIQYMLAHDPVDESVDNFVDKMPVIHRMPEDVSQ